MPNVTLDVKGYTTPDFTINVTLNAGCVVKQDITLDSKFIYSKDFKEIQEVEDTIP